MRDIAVFANELCDLFQRYENNEIEFAVHDLLARFKPSVSLEFSYCQKLIAAVFEKLKQFAPIFEINVATNNYCQAVQSWVETHVAPDEAEAALAQGASK